MVLNTSQRTQNTALALMVSIFANIRSMGLSKSWLALLENDIAPRPTITHTKTVLRLMKYKIDHEIHVDPFFPDAFDDAASRESRLPLLSQVVVANY